MFCPKCGVQNLSTSRFCVNCGNELSPARSEGIINPYQTSSGSGSHFQAPPPKEESANILYAILSFVIPLVGFVLYFTNKDDSKNKANTYLVCGIIGFVFGLLFYL
ncbi:MAG: zinc-ribbon domain-containing protein [Sphingobacteriia bacterium]|nr:zinc-ribbon domain-containing protein [Sphingobacteriia bacterium]